MSKFILLLLLPVFLLEGCIYFKKFKCAECNNKTKLKQAGDKFASRRLRQSVANFNYHLIEDTLTYQLVYDNCKQSKKDGYISTCVTIILFVSKSTCKLIEYRVLI